MPEKIFLTYTNATAVPYQGSVLGHHVVINYVDSNGHHHTLQGVPEHKFEHNLDKLGASAREEILSDGVNNTDSPFQRLQAGPELIDSDVSLSRPHTMVAEGDDLSSRWALMRDFADEVNSIGYEYRPISQNSNSFAGGALQRAGFLGPGNEFPERFDRQLAHDPASGETRSFCVPGFEAPLTNPINTATPMPFPLDVPAPPLVPADGVTAPGRHGSLDNGSGNCGSAPALLQGAPADRPVRYLGRRTDSLSQGAVINPAASGATSQRPPQGPLSPNDAYLEYLKQLNANPSQPLAIDASALAAPLVPSDDSIFSGGLLGRLTALMGIDPQNPDRLAPPPQDDQRTFYRDPAQQRILQRLR